mmetsp:Transcript_4093/g.5093  ORF Transcript_4093/g.5093 Transcript_4093/m.5093 type:complete len:110 (+) Transcript_4093:73-402(+)
MVGSLVWEACTVQLPRLTDMKGSLFQKSMQALCWKACSVHMLLFRLAGNLFWMALRTLQGWPNSEQDKKHDLRGLSMVATMWGKEPQARIALFTHCDGTAKAEERLRTI